MADKGKRKSTKDHARCVASNSVFHWNIWIFPSFFSSSYFPLILFSIHVTKAEKNRLIEKWVVLDFLLFFFTFDLICTRQQAFSFEFHISKCLILCLLFFYYIYRRLSHESTINCHIFPNLRYNRIRFVVFRPIQMRPVVVLLVQFFRHISQFSALWKHNHQSNSKRATKMSEANFKMIFHCAMKIRHTCLRTSVSFHSNRLLSLSLVLSIVSSSSSANVLFSLKDVQRAIGRLSARSQNAISREKKRIFSMHHDDKCFS